MAGNMEALCFVISEGERHQKRRNRIRKGTAVCSTRKRKEWNNNALVSGTFFVLNEPDPDLEQRSTATEQLRGELERMSQEYGSASLHLGGIPAKQAACGDQFLLARGQLRIDQGDLDFPS
jgi:hypothetical protein